MTLEQKGAYHELLCVSWQVGPLPDDERLLAKYLQVNVRTFRRLWIWPLTACWEKHDFGLINPRLEKERECADRKSKAGQKAVKYRWNKETPHATAKRPDSDGLANGKLSRSRSRSNKKEEDLAQASPRADEPNNEKGKILWRTDHDELGDEKSPLLMDDEFKRWVHRELNAHAEELARGDPDGPQKVELAKNEYDDVVREAIHRLIEEPRLRATEKSKPKKHKEFRTWLTNRFKFALSRKRARLARSQQSRASPAESYTQSEQEVYDSQRPEMTPELEKKYRESGEKRRKYEADKLAKQKAKREARA